MESKTTTAIILVLYICLSCITLAVSRPRGVKNHHHHNHNNHHQHINNYNHHHSSSTNNQNRSKSHGVKSSSSYWRPSDEDYDYDDGGGRHAYLMTTDNKKSSAEKLNEDQTLTQAFEQHMRPTNKNAKNAHDVYAYQLPSDLWFVVRYTKNSEGQVEKYMNIVDSFTNYLDKLEKGVKTVSVNVKGVETVFRLTTKHKPT